MLLYQVDTNTIHKVIVESGSTAADAAGTEY